MEENDKREMITELDSLIERVGIKRTIKNMQKQIKKNGITIIKDSFENLKKDLKCGKIRMNDTETNILIDTIEENKNNIPIFEIEDDNIEYKIKFPLIPFKKMYIATNICEIIDEDLYAIGGFFVIDIGTDLIVIYYWSKIIKDGWAFASFLCGKDGIIKKYDEKRTGGNFKKDDEKINRLAIKKFSNLLKKLIYKITKKEYTTYKKYSHGNYHEKNIVFAYDVQTHKRHFWNDTGYFNIPKLSQEDLLEQGYGIDEIVLKDNQLRKDVPFKIIGEFRVGEVKKEEHKVYDMIERRHLRQEEKLYKILRELFPNEYIKKHDRKELKGLELDFFIIKKRLAFEYDGEQHFDRKLCEEVFKSDFDALQKRDRRKNHLCRNKMIKLIRIKYDEPLTKTYIKKILLS